MIYIPFVFPSVSVFLQPALISARCAFYLRREICRRSQNIIVTQMISFIKEKITKKRAFLSAVPRRKPSAVSEFI